MTSSLLVVGSIPCATVEEVFRTWGGRFGADLKYMPDGEVGDRLHWIDGQAYRVFHGHPDIETLQRPAPDDGVERWKPRDITDQWTFRVRPGVARVRFGEPGWRLGYARDAINSYFVFKTLKKEGVLAPHLRFMVALPTPESAVALFFKTPADVPKVLPDYEAAMLAEVENILAHVPQTELAIQWDAACESVDIEFGLPWLGGAITAQRYARYVAQFGRLSAAIPDEVALGYHACFGTLGGWPTVKPDTIANEVRFLNDIVARTPRRVDFVHLPLLDRSDAEYAAPLADLKVGDAEIYLGMVHNLPSFATRLANARRYLPTFKLAAPCGFGRIAPDQVAHVMREHEEALRLFAAS